MALYCPKCRKQLSFWSNRNGKPFPCPACGTDIKITEPPIPALFWFLPPIIDALFLLIVGGISSNKAVVSLAHEPPLSPLPTPKPEIIDFEKMQKSAAEGNADAQFYLGGIYFTGHGTQRNFEEAYFWHSLAAKSGKSKEELDSLRRYLPAGRVAAIEERVTAWLKAHPTPPTKK